jgi:hypothetical protein
MNDEIIQKIGKGNSAVEIEKLRKLARLTEPLERAGFKARPSYRIASPLAGSPRRPKCQVRRSR